jgi:hypothetical protein
VQPTFIIAGAPRSGTTYLYDLLDSHPGIFMAKPKTPEPKFFLDDEQFHRGFDYYCERYFAGGAGFVAVGEKSTNYLENPHVARRISELLSGVRLIFVLRNPVDRAYSNYRWSVQNGLESLGFVEAIQQEGVREGSYPDRWKYARPFSYISRGHYARLLRPYFELFHPSRIKVLLLDEIEAAPAAVANDLFDFLEVPPVRLSFDFTKRVNASTAADPGLPSDVVRQLHELYEAPNQDLAALLQRDISCWKLSGRSK